MIKNLELERKQQFKHQFKKRCYEFSLIILKISKRLRTKGDNYVLIDQLARSATSIGANVVEGGSSSSKKEFIKFFHIALKSASESLYWLSLLKEMNLDKYAELMSLIKECQDIKKLLSTIIINTKNNS